MEMQWNAIQCNEMQFNAIQCNEMQWNAMKCNSMQWNAMKCNSMQWNAIQCNGMQWNAMKCNEMQFNAINAMKCNEMKCNSMQWNAIQCNEMQWNAMKCNSMQFNAMKCNEMHSFCMFLQYKCQVCTRYKAGPEVCRWGLGGVGEASCAGGSGGAAVQTWHDMNEGEHDINTSWTRHPGTVCQVDHVDHVGCDRTAARKHDSWLSNCWLCMFFRPLACNFPGQSQSSRQAAQTLKNWICRFAPKLVGL